ncbi:MAG: alpha-L-fucosidase [Lachnospiraceae bacterium]|jgi:alpha-L-fucosidase
MTGDFIWQAAHVVPSKRQLAWFDLESYSFIHFGMNTFTDREWGTGKEDERIFNPEKLDCGQWVDAIKAAGMKGMVLVAKHHDGFCLWDTETTRHSVRYSPFHRDIVKEAADACRKGGIRFGFYLSPWDRNSALYGTPAYNDFFCSQLTELLTRYGDIFCVWFDNACGEGPNGKKQVYDFPRYISLIREYQPDAVIFNDFGPDVRWCGNEAGTARESEWAVVPSELCSYAEVQTGPGPLAEKGDLSWLYNTGRQIGTMNTILYSKGLAFVPSEINTSIRPGWFWHEKEEPKSVDELFRIYLASVGGNACLNLNLPPDRDGLIDARDVRRLKELRQMIGSQFGNPLQASVSKDAKYPQQPVYHLHFSEETAVKDLQYVVLEEKISEGQRVESFQIEADSARGKQYPFYQGTTIGHRKVCRLQDPYAGQNPLTRFMDDRIADLNIRITSARDVPELSGIRVYASPRRDSSL